MHVATEASEDAAARVLARIDAAGERLLRFPLSGPSREHFAAGLRVTFAGEHAIYYLVSETRITITRVLHGARDAMAMAARGDLA